MAVERAICVVSFCFFALGSATICNYDSESNQFSGESCCSDSVCRRTCYYCTFDFDCGTGERCCDGGDCLSSCPTASPWTLPTFPTLATIAPISYCFFDSDCESDNVCCDGDCLAVCPSTWTGASIVGAVVGTIVFFAIIISIVACCCCACCPYYRYRSSPGAVVMSQPATHQTFVSTTQMSIMSSQPIQHYPPSGPPPTNYNQLPPPNYIQPPPASYNQPPPPNYNQPPPPGYDQETSPYDPGYPQQQAQYPPPPAPPPPPPVQGQPPMPSPVNYY